MLDGISSWVTPSAAAQPKPSAIPPNLFRNLNKRSFGRELICRGFLGCTMHCASPDFHTPVKDALDVQVNQRTFKKGCILPPRDLLFVQ